jgi:peptidoglycan/LPS O-acetylase OafA/YrhL
MFRLGFAGVFLFFVLSGFIILTAHIHDVGSPRRLTWYLARRLIRIYPIYWIVFIVWGGWRFVSIKPDLGELALNALLFSAKSKLVIAVGWTLLYEIIFYAMFALLVINKRLGIAAMLIWFAGVLLFHDRANHQMLHPFNLLFMFGLASSAIFFRLQKLPPAWGRILGALGLALGTTLFVGTALAYSTLDVDKFAWQSHPMSVVGFGLASALMILAAASPALEGFFQRWSLMGLLGNASYSIYLVHLQFEKIFLDATRLLAWLWQPANKSGLAADALFLFVSAAAVA